MGSGFSDLREVVGVEEKRIAEARRFTKRSLPCAFATARWPRQRLACAKYVIRHGLSILQVRIACPFCSKSFAALRAHGILCDFGV